MTALLNLHKLYRDNLSSDELLNRIVLRQTVISMAYEKLYQTGNYPMIEFKTYISDLISKTSRVLSEYKSDVSINKEIDEFTLPLKKAMPAAQIIMELLSNSHMHAFNGSAVKNEISLTVSGSEDSIRILYADNGCGFPEGFDPAERGTLGMQFIMSLSKQLRGTAEFSGDPYGSVFSLSAGF